MTIQRVEYPPGTGGGGSPAPVGYTHGDQWFLKDSLGVGFGGNLASPIHLPDKFNISALAIKDGPTPKASSPSLLDGYKINPGSAAFRDGVKTKLTDSLGIITATTSQPDTLHLPDTFNGRTAALFFGRSGTPDTDMFGDAWVDGLLANQGVNHGNETLQIDGSAAGAADHIGFFEVDLTRFTNIAANGTLTVNFIVTIAPTATVPAVAPFATMTATFSKFAARPFTESTLTFTNKPADGTSIVTKTTNFSSISLGTTLTFTLTSTEYGPYLSNFMMVRLTSDQLLNTGQVVLGSRDGALANRPFIEFDFKR